MAKNNRKCHLFQAMNKKEHPKINFLQTDSLSVPHQTNLASQHLMMTATYLRMPRNDQPVSRFYNHSCQKPIL